MTEQTAELEVRESQLASVNYPKRLIELIVAPYESPATVAYRGKLIEEIVSRGAYDGVEQRASRIKVNRGHEMDRVVGKTVALHPSRLEGLVAEIRISRTELGEETLILADDGVLDASAGFMLLMDRQTGRTVPGAEVWETRDRRRLNKLRLDHIAMTPDPAYQDARVLAVRTLTQPDESPLPATPNRDQIELERIRALAADIDKRYGLSR